MDLLLRNIGQLATPQGSAAHSGAAQGEIQLIEKAAVGVEGNTIVYVGEDAPCLAAQTEVDCGGRLVTPGLVDCHTHLVFGGWRQKELAQKLAGVSYVDILKGGGGILSTVRATRAASEQELEDKALALLQTMLCHGTTTCECKSGYGLDAETELKQLRVVKRLSWSQHVQLVSTFLGAHAMPQEYKDDRAAYIRLVCDEVLPLVARENLAEFCDVFCETAAFTVGESRQVLSAAGALGLGLRAHVDEIDAIGGAEMAAELGCVTAEHLIQATDAGIQALAASGTIACLLPATSFYLNKPYARARAMVEKEVPVAVATDFNPGSSPSPSLQLAMTLACLKYRLTPAEALCAVTLNAAAAIGRAGQLGSLEVGKQADIAVWDAPDLDMIFYRYGYNQIYSVYKRGRLAHRNLDCFEL